MSRDLNNRRLGEPRQPSAWVLAALVGLGLVALALAYRRCHLPPPPALHHVRFLSIEPSVN